MTRYFLLFAMICLAGCAAETVSQQTLGSVDPKLATLETSTPDRKIIYEAAIKLIVTDLSSLENEIPKLVKEHEGYLALVSIDRTQGEYRTGSWTVRVPVARYEEFLGVISKLGVAKTFDQKSQDVTEEFVDLESRIANSKKLEQRIAELLQKPGEEINAVIEVERELARVRGEIEKMEGRMRFLNNQTAFTTVTIAASEQKQYVPPQAPTLIDRISQSWSDSLTMLRHGGENILVAAVFLLPWVAFIAAAVSMLWAIRRHRIRRARIVGQH